MAQHLRQHLGWRFFGYQVAALAQQEVSTLHDLLSCGGWESDGSGEWCEEAPCRRTDDARLFGKRQAR